MFELIASAVITLMAVIISYMAVKIGVCGNGKRRPGFRVFLELDWILEKTPAQASYFMFLLQAFIFVAAAAFASRVSNHIILTLDILYLLSSLILVLYHNIKIAASLSIQKL